WGDLGTIRQVSGREDLQAEKRLGSLLEATRYGIRPSLVVVEGQAKDLLALAANPQGIFRSDPLREGLEATSSGCEQGHSLEEVGALDSLQDLVFLEALEPRIPVLAQVILVRGISRREQLEYGQGHSAGIDLLEDLANSLLGCLLSHENEGDLILLETLDHRREQLVEAVESLLHLAWCNLYVCPLPGHQPRGIVHQVKGEKLRCALLLRRRIVSNHFVAKVANLPVFRNADNRLLAVAVGA